MTKPLFKSTQRISEFGEVFTPLQTVDAMLAQIPDSSWEDPEAIFLEPTCGNGNFILEIIKKRLIHGLSLSEAVETCFGMDICPENIRECRNRIYKASYRLLEKFSDLVLLVAITRHNFFQVEDSLKWLPKHWESYPLWKDLPSDLQKEQKKEIRRELEAYFAGSEKRWFEE